MTASLPRRETDSKAEADLATHAAKTKAVHGIADVADLVTADQLAEALKGLGGGGGGGGSAFVWEAVELGANVTPFGAPYAPEVKVGQDGELGHLSGLLTIGAGGIAGGDVLFVIPKPARPKFKKIVPAIDGNNPTAAGLMPVVVEPDGKVKCAVAFNAGQIPSFDGASYSLTN